MIIDGHTHVFADPRLQFIPGAPPLMSAEQQLAVMDAKGIDKSIVLPIVGPMCQSIGEVLEICRRYPDKFIPFCNFTPRLQRRPDKICVEDFDFIVKQYKNMGCRGLGEITERMYFDDPVMLCLFESCQKHDMPVIFHTQLAEDDSYGLMDEIGFPRLEKVLGMFPELKIFGHSAGFWSEISGEVDAAERNDYPKSAVKPGGAITRLMRKYPNLYGDMSAGSGHNAMARDPEHGYKFIAEFSDRLMFGQDYCSVWNDHKQLGWLTAAKDAGHITGDDHEKLMWKNANRLLKLGIEESQVK